jgi:hypothetical protein
MTPLEAFGRWHADRGRQADDLLAAAALFCACHRRHGLALRRYRGAHRDTAWPAAELIAAVRSQSDSDRRAHLRSLRRPCCQNPDAVTPVFIGSREVRYKFYGVVSDIDGGLGSATLTLEPPEALSKIPVAVPLANQGFGAYADDAPTGPIHG